MSQFDLGVIDPDAVDGLALADGLNGFSSAVYSGHRGPTRPPYAVAGMIWVQSVSATLTHLRYFDGAVDHLILSLNPSSGVIVDAAPFLRDAGNLNAGSVPAARLPFSTKAQAEAGVSLDVVMSPKRFTEALVKSGAWGISGTSLPVVADLAAVDTIAPGLHAVTGATAGKPSGVTFGTLIHARRAAIGGEVQILIADGSGATMGKMYSRARTSGAWGDWLASLDNTDAANTVEAEAGVNDAKFMTPKTTAEAIAALAGGGVDSWVNFNGNGVVAIRATSGFSSITDLGPGNYTANFVEDQPDTNYAAVASGGAGAGSRCVAHVGSLTVSGFNIYTQNHGNGYLADAEYVSAAVFR